MSKTAAIRKVLRAHPHWSAASIADTAGTTTQMVHSVKHILKKTHAARTAKARAARQRKAKESEAMEAIEKAVNSQRTAAVHNALAEANVGAVLGEELVALSGLVRESGRSVPQCLAALEALEQLQ